MKIASSSVEQLCPLAARQRNWIDQNNDCKNARLPLLMRVIRHLPTGLYATFALQGPLAVLTGVNNLNLFR